MYKFALAFAVPVFVLALASGTAMADPKDYRFEAVQPHVQASPNAVIAVRLIHIPDNKPVPGAVVFGAKMEMPMAGMAPMGTKVKAASSSAAGEYPFESDLSMDGQWVLSLSAKVQGESGTVTGSVPFMVMK